MHTRPSVWMLDEPELERTRHVVERLGCGLAVSDFTSAAPPNDALLWVTSARKALEIRRSTSLVPWIAIHDGPLDDMREPLRALGVHFLVHAALDELSLELLVGQLLYRGGERRTSPRLPLGCEIAYKTERRYAKAVVSDISVEACMLVCDNELDPGDRIDVVLPAEALGGRCCQLAGEVVRCTRDENQLGFAALVRFRAMGPGTQEGLRDLVQGMTCVSRVAPLAVLPVREPLAPANATAVAKAVSGVDDTPEASTTIDLDQPDPELFSLSPLAVIERRGGPRSLFIQAVPAIRSVDARVPSAVLGRDLSMKGLRVAPQPDLAVGERTAVAICGGNGREPIVLEATVIRDDGLDGLVLRFERLDAEEREHLCAVVADLPAIESLKLRS